MTHRRFPPRRPSQGALRANAAASAPAGATRRRNTAGSGADARALMLEALEAVKEWDCAGFLENGGLNIPHPLREKIQTAIAAGRAEMLGAKRRQDALAADPDASET